MKSIRIFLLLCCAFAVSVAFSAETLHVDGVDFDEDGNLDEVRYVKEDGHVDLGFRLTSTGVSKIVRIEKPDICSVPSVYFNAYNQELVVDSSCSGQGGQILIQLYKFDAAQSALCLSRVVYGQKLTQESDHPVPEYAVSRFAGCPKIGDRVSWNYPASMRVDDGAYARTLLALYEGKMAEGSVQKEFGKFSNFDAAEISSLVSVKNVRVVNDLGYFLVESERFEAASIVLRKVVVLFPDRMVARLNLADAYWGAEYFDQARMQYRVYAEMMKNRGLSAKLPERVCDRIK